MILIVFWLIFGTIFAFVCSSMTRKRNRDTGMWGLMGFLLGLIAVIVLAIAGDAKAGG